MTINRTCVKRPYGTSTDFVPVGKVLTLSLGETLYTGLFDSRTVSVDSPMGRCGASDRSILVPSGELTETKVDQLYLQAHMEGNPLFIGPVDEVVPNVAAVPPPSTPRVPTAHESAYKVCVRRSTGPGSVSYVAVESEYGLQVGETLYCGQFYLATVTIPGPFTGGVGSSERTIFIPDGELEEFTADAGYVADHKRLQKRA